MPAILKGPISITGISKFIQNVVAQTSDKTSINLAGINIKTVHNQLANIFLLSQFKHSYLILGKSLHHHLLNSPYVFAMDIADPDEWKLGYLGNIFGYTILSDVHYTGITGSENPAPEIPMNSMFLSRVDEKGGVGLILEFVIEP